MIAVAAMGDVGATRAAGCGGTGCAVGGALAVSETAAGFVAGAAVFCGVFRFVRGLTRSGNSFGAIAAHSHNTAIEMMTAVKIRFSISGDRVPTSGIEHMAPGKPPHAQPGAAYDTILLDRLHHVDGATRFEAAHRRQERGKKQLVAPKNGDHRRVHEPCDAHRPRSVATRCRMRCRSEL